MGTDSRKGVFSQIMLKMTKNSNACKSFRITAKALKLIAIILRFMYFSEKQFIFGSTCQILGRDRWKIWAK